MDEATSAQVNYNHSDVFRPLARGLIIFTSIWLVIILILIGPKVGYCQGWWLQSNPWAYYWWLCSCGTKTEENLYPDNVEIVVSACRDPDETVLSPDGRYLIVRKHLQRESYLLDLVTGEEQSWLYPFWSRGDIEFLTHKLMHVRLPNQKGKLVDVTDNSTLNLSVLPTNRDDQNLIDSSALEILRKADRIIIRETSSTSKVLVLDTQPKQNLANNYILFLSNKIEQEKLEKIFLENGITYEKWRPCTSSSSSCMSHDGRFIGTHRAILTSSNRKLLAELQGGPAFRRGAVLHGWAHDDSGIYLQFNPNSYIISGGFAAPPLFRVPQPIIKLKLPEEYR